MFFHLEEMPLEEGLYKIFMLICILDLILIIYMHIGHCEKDNQRVNASSDRSDKHRRLSEKEGNILHIKGRK